MRVNQRRGVFGIGIYILKNKTNHPISSNSHPATTANEAIHILKIEGGYKTNGNIILILTKYEAVLPTVLSENNS